MIRAMSLLLALDRFVAAVLRSFVIAALAITLVLITLGVVARVVPVFSMSGYDEIIEWLIAWMTFAGTVALWREGTLFRIDLVAGVSSGAVARTINIVAQLLMLAFALVFTWKGYDFAAESIETMPFLFVSKIPWYAAMPACGAAMIVYGTVGVYRACVDKLPAPPVAAAP